MSGEDEDDRFRILSFEEYKKRFEDRRRRDGRPYTESNIRYAYRFHPWNVGKSRGRTGDSEAAKTASRRKRRHNQEGTQSPQEGTSKRPRQGEPTSGPSWRLSEDEDDWLADVYGDIEESILMGDSRDDSMETAVVGGGDRSKRSTDGNDPSGQGSSSSGRTGALRYIGASKSSNAVYSFEHTHLLNTWGNAYSISTLGKDFETKCMITSLAHIPVQLVSFWMSFAEYKKLPRGTRVVSVECVVIPKGFKTSFDTGVSVTSSANNTQGIFGQVAVGLNRRILCREFAIERDKVKPMVITSISKPKAAEIADRLWGHATFEDGKFEKSIPSCMGIPRSLKMYCGVLMPYKKASHAAGPLSVGWPDMMKNTRTFNYLDHLEESCVYYKYDVKTNCINNKVTQVILDDTVDHKALMGGEDIRLTGGASDTTSFTITKQSKLNSVPPSEMTYASYIEEHIEQCHSITIPDHTPPNSGKPMPSLHIGILPVQSNSPENEMIDYVSCCATWEIKTKITLSTDMHSHYTYTDIYEPGKVPFGKSYRGMAAMYNQTTHGFAPICNSCTT